jgi:hypothetical protein
MHKVDEGREILREKNLFFRDPLIMQDSPAGLKASIPLATTTTSGLLTEHHPTPMMSNGVSLLIQDYDDPDLWTALGYSSELNGFLDHLL